MQRLYAMFPDGGPGLGLLVLRIALQSGGWMSLSVFSAQIGASASLSLVCVLSLALVLGVWTTGAATVAAGGALTAAAFAHGDAIGHCGTLALLGASSALLGPGAYSLDAAIYGRRVLNVPGIEPPNEKFGGSNGRPPKD
jgi:hypothetical protein